MTVVATCQTCGKEVINESNLDKLRLLINQHEKFCRDENDLSMKCVHENKIRDRDGLVFHPSCGCRLWNGVACVFGTPTNRRPWVVYQDGDLLRRSNGVGRSFKSAEAAKEASLGAVDSVFLVR